MEIRKLCGFCINEWHLTTMILPYINNKINENYKIITVLEKNIENNIKTLTEKLNLKNEEKVNNINWNELISKKYREIKNKLDEIIKNENNYIIFVYGNKEFIDMENINIEKWIEKNSEINRKINIINCYDIAEFNYNINEILNTHDKIINTSGEKEIEEVFEGFKTDKKEANKI